MLGRVEHGAFISDALEPCQSLNTERRDVNATFRCTAPAITRCALLNLKHLFYDGPDKSDVITRRRLARALQLHSDNTKSPMILNQPNRPNYLCCNMDKIAIPAITSHFSVIERTSNIGKTNVFAHGASKKMLVSITPLTDCVKTFVKIQ